MKFSGKNEAIFRLSRLRIAYAVAFVCAFAATEIGRYVYRPYVYRSGLNDFGLADTMGNSLGVVTQIFFTLAVVHATWRQALGFIAFIVCGYIAYEYLQPVLPKGTFDIKDVIATVAGGVIALGVLWLCRRLAGDRVLSSAKMEETDPGAA